MSFFLNVVQVCDGEIAAGKSKRLALVTADPDSENTLGTCRGFSHFRQFSYSISPAGCQTSIRAHRYERPYPIDAAITAGIRPASSVNTRNAGECGKARLDDRSSDQ
jgi:hypothetical protein